LILTGDPVYFTEDVDGLTGAVHFDQHWLLGSPAVHFHTTELALPISQELI
jgi:hypothetical protein